MSESDVPDPGQTPASDKPTPAAAPTPASSPANLAAAADGARSADPRSFGRVDDDGTVYVRTDDGERAVGQVPDATPEEALTFFTRRFDALALEVQLLSTRVGNGTVGPDEARKSASALRKSIAEANAVGDLAALSRRLESLTPVLEEAQAKRREEKARSIAEAKQAKEKMVAEAEKLAAGNDWRGGVNRFRALLDEWRALPRIDKATDDELWHRFSSARSSYTKRRKAQFSQQAKQRAEAQTVKERIIAEAEGLATSTDWGPTAGAFRELMNRWKAAGPAPREVDDKLWARFRGIQDQFFGARNAELDKQNEEFLTNQKAKEELLATYEPKVRPEEDLSGSRAAFREFLERWSEIGKVPREAIRPLDQRVKAMERSLSSVEQAEWKRTDPEARARAEDTAAKLRNQIEELEAKASKAEARGDASAAKKARESAETYRTWLEQAEKAVRDFSA
ncbi:DUF349 domain-containing protein [Naumannella halotolerans]|uniref:DUF349 domain-containing protein n=1 Tax=Naumannella halotolerans TaxID=993414 RepID=UPI00370D9C11